MLHQELYCNKCFKASHTPVVFMDGVFQVVSHEAFIRCEVFAFYRPPVVFIQALILQILPMAFSFCPCAQLLVAKPNLN